MLNSERIEILQITEMLSDKIQPKGFIEIGSRDGHDAELIKNFWNIPAYIIEPHPESIRRIKENYPNIDSYEFAAFDENGTSQFNAIRYYDDKQNNLLRVGTSSLLECKYVKHIKDIIPVTTKRMDTFLDETGIIADIIKIDAEGVAYEILKGYGDKLKDLMAIQVELEIDNWFIGQRLANETFDLLSKDFNLIHQKNETNFQVACLFLNKCIL